MIFERLLVVDNRFDGHRTADEIGIAHLNTWHHVVVATGTMHILAVGTQEDTILNDVVAAATTKLHLVELQIVTGMLPATLYIELHVVGNEVAQLSLQTDIELLGTTIAEVEPGERSTRIDLSLFKLSTGCKRHQHHC